MKDNYNYQEDNINRDFEYFLKRSYADKTTLTNK